MPLESRKYLFDILQAAEWISEFVKGKTFADYAGEPMLRLAVERCFSILGEAVSQLARLDAGTAGQIPEFRRIIAFRNILIHSYAQTDDRLVWNLVETRLPDLVQTTKRLLED
jgi:uncharacterized protein with HEPN domain